MSDRTHVTVHVEIDPLDGSIAGRLLEGDGDGRSFAGWMGLAAAIEGALPGRPGRATATGHADEQAGDSQLQRRR